jgi:hypothetical protein
MIIFYQSFFAQKHTNLCFLFRTKYGYVLSHGKCLCYNIFCITYPKASHLAISDGKDYKKEVLYYEKNNHSSAGSDRSRCHHRLQRK